ncbi:hypothetical protein ACFPFV_12225 [Salinicoccus siamensis]
MERSSGLSFLFTYPLSAVLDCGILLIRYQQSMEALDREQAFQP